MRVGAHFAMLNFISRQHLVGYQMMEPSHFHRCWQKLYIVNLSTYITNIPCRDHAPNHCSIRSASAYMQALNVSYGALYLNACLHELTFCLRLIVWKSCLFVDYMTNCCEKCITGNNIARSTIMETPSIVDVLLGDTVMGIPSREHCGRSAVAEEPTGGGLRC